MHLRQLKLWQIVFNKLECRLEPNDYVEQFFFGRPQSI